MINTLEAILKKARKLTGTGNTQQGTDSDFLDALNSFYLYDFPAEFRSLKLKDTYSFNTVQGVDTYPFDFNQWSTLQAPAYCEKGEMLVLFSKTEFYRYYFSVQQRETFDTADGTEGPYAGTTLSSPLLRSVNNNPIVDTPLSNTGSFPTGYPPTFTNPNISRVQNILISANTSNSSLVVTDDGAGNLIGDCLAGGTINYQTGVISALTFTNAVPSGNNIEISYIPVTLGQPYTLLFDQQQITLRPVPDKAYTIDIMAYRLPSQALLGSGSNIDLEGIPELNEWQDCLAFGLSKKIYQNRLDPEGVAMMDLYLKEAYSLIETRTYAQLGQDSMRTIYNTTSRGGVVNYNNFGSI